MKAKLMDIASGDHPGLHSANLRAKVKEMVSEFRAVDYEFRCAIRDALGQKRLKKLAKKRRILSQQIYKTNRVLENLNG